MHAVGFPVLCVLAEIGHVGVELVADGEHEVGQDGKFEQAVPPVLLVLAGVEVLCLAAQGELFVELILAFHNRHVAFHRTALALNYRFVVALVGIHEVEFELLGEFLLELHVYVLIIDLAAHFEEL